MKPLKLPVGELAVILSTVFWGCISLFSRTMNVSGFTAVQTVAVRAVITTALLGVFMLIKNRAAFRIRLKDGWLFVGSGICSFLFFNVCYMSSIAENSVSVACVLMYTSPFWILLLSVPIFKEKVTAKHIAALLIALCGCVLLCTAGTLKLTGIGLVYGLLSGIGYALYSIFGKLAAQQYSTLTITFYTFLFAAVAVSSLFGCSDTRHVACKTCKRSAVRGHCIDLYPHSLYAIHLRVIPYSRRQGRHFGNF